MYECKEHVDICKNMLIQKKELGEYIKREREAEVTVDRMLIDVKLW